MKPSFRLRLALFSALLSGVVLTAFGCTTWWVIRASRMERIDRDVRMQAERESQRWRDAAEWQRVEANMVAESGIGNSADLILLVEDGSGGVVYRSPGWPEDLDATKLPWPQQAAGQEGTQAAQQQTAGADDANGRPPRPDHSADEARRPPPRPDQGAEDANRPPPRPDAGADDANRPPPPDNGADDARRPPPPPDNGAEDANRPPPPPDQRAEDGRRPPPRRQQGSDKAKQAPAKQKLTNEAQPPAPRRGQQPVPAGPPPVSREFEQTAAGRHWHIGLATTGRARIAVALDGAAVDAEMKGIFSAFLLALPLCLALIGIGGWTLSGRALRPLRTLSATARTVTAEGLGQRISSGGADREFAELIEVFNGMLERLERSFKQAYRFSADAAHELRTPLAILQGQIEQAIHAAEDGSAMQAQLTGILDEVRRLSTISRKLLLLSQADAGGLKIQSATFDLSKALMELVEDTAMLAPHLLVTGDIQPGLVVRADENLLPQVLHNLISNAIKHNVDHGWIRISTAIGAKQIEVCVANSSAGIPAAERSRIFDRFFRAAPTLNSRTEGVGLGLSVSREIARAHGGDITFNVDAEDVVRFSLLLPAPANGSGAVSETVQTT